MKTRVPSAIVAFALAWLAQNSLHALSVEDLAAGHQLKLQVARGYLPGLGVLVRLEVRNAQGDKERALWDAEATLAVEPSGVTLSTNRVRLRNGVGSELVILTGDGNFTLTATVGGLQASRALVTLAGAPVTEVGGTLAEADTTWSGLIRMTNNVTVPTNGTLILLPGTLVLVKGGASNAAAADFIINGAIQSLGTEDDPVTITSSDSVLRWGQIRHARAQFSSAPLSLYRFTSITRGGRAGGEGHTGQAPVIRPTNARIRFEHCNLTDHAEMVRGATGFGTPGKIMQGSGSDVTFDDCILARARMGPEIGGTALLCTNTWITDMLGTDDADGIYIHAQSAGQQCVLRNCVLANGDDDGIDTLDSVISVEDCIIRDWHNLGEDAKGISIFNGATHVNRSLIVDCTVGISAKCYEPPESVLVTINNSTVTGNLTNVLAQKKSNAPGPIIDYRITNSVLWGGDAVASDFAPTNFTIVYSDMSEPWEGTGNITEDPAFSNPVAFDFRLQPGSPCIDAGDPGSLLDPDGSLADMGCCVFVPPAPALSAPEKQPEGFVFLLNAYPNRNYVIETSSNAVQWSARATVFATNLPTPVLDAIPDAPPQRYYKARLAP